MSDEAELSSPNPITALNTAKLEAYLVQTVEGFSGPIQVDKFPNGQSNPTFLINAPGQSAVLRRKPPGKLLPSAHAVDREFRVLKALHGSDVPVAKPIVLCEDDSVIGSMFYVMSYEEGDIFWDPALPELNSTAREAYFSEIIRVLAALHNVDIKHAGLSDFGKPGNYFERQYIRWEKQYRAAETKTIDALEELIKWLGNNLPKDTNKPSLIHGDYRLDNFIFASKQPKMRAVLDWELSTLGNPLADLGYFLMCLRLPRFGPIKGLMGIERSDYGIPEDEALVELYCRLRGIEVLTERSFYIAFAFFRLAAIAQGVYKRALGGNASHKQAIKIGDSVEPIAQLALAEIAKR